MTNRLALVAAVAALSTAVPAAAVTINFDTFPNGQPVPDVTPISTQYSALGITFSAVLGTDSTVLPGATSYAAGNQNSPVSSGNYLGNASRAELFVTTPVFQLVPRYDILRLTFNGTANNVSLSLNNFSLVGTTTFNAYGANGQLLQSFTTNAGNGWDVRTLSANGIARLDLLNNVFNGSPTYFGIDNVNFTLNAVGGAVPEPATWAMMLLGFGAVGYTVRRRRESGARIRYA